jgi:uncharacterized protein YciI
MYHARNYAILTLGILLFNAFGCIERVERAAQTGTDTLSSGEPNYEMITYYLVLLRRGPNWTADVTPKIEELQKQHLAHINRMAETGDLVLAGPFLEQTGDSALAGLFIFKVESIQTARELTQSDPAVKAGRLVYEVIPWMGPSTLSY